ncbi:MAG: uroporphyrinogen decarboxylase [Acidobacteria bacterium]|nr:uroporphyrinogen decarboxylase [Acidobacteriota bacterium]MBV9145904.1 uroporphyrinogen decarboxylase [Acidobacteriota bacterium]MBV9435797.1 uroporphyrinogen decarboxylase [Acidobacteriota bacterium]
MSAPDSIFVRACRRIPVESTPVWLMRQAGRYMPEYRRVRKQHSILEICKNPELAAEVTVTAAERLGVDAAIIFADLLLPLEVMGLDFEFREGEGPKIASPIRDSNAIARIKTDRPEDLGYVSEAVSMVARHFAHRLPVIGFCGAPFTLASYMIEGGGSRQYSETKRLMYGDPEAWEELLRRIVRVVSQFAAQQVSAGADVLQVFDSWAGSLSPSDYARFVLPQTKVLISELKATGAPVIYFATDSAMLLPYIKQTRAEVIGVDWRIAIDDAFEMLGPNFAVQGNLDPAALFAPERELRRQVREVLERAAGRAGHIFNLGHGILPETPVENVLALIDEVHAYSATRNQSPSSSVAF